MTVSPEDTAELFVPPTGRARDRRSWLAVPLVTLVLAPALTISLAVLVGESENAYPRVCDAHDRATNGCQETIFSMFVLHTLLFLAGWLLLWAIPWWRDLNRWRITAAVVVGAILVAAPLRLADRPDLTDLLSIEHWDELGRDAPTAGEANHLVAAYVVIGLLLVAAPIALLIRSLRRDRRRLAAAGAVLTLLMLIPAYQLAHAAAHTERRARHLEYVPDPDPPCQVHSGSNDVCPGG